MYHINAEENIVIILEEVGLIEREMLVAGDISVEGTKILLRRAHSKGKKFILIITTQLFI